MNHQFNFDSRISNYNIFSCKCSLNHTPANTRRCFDVDSKSFERYGRQMDVETTLYAYWDALSFIFFKDSKLPFNSL